MSNLSDGLISTRQTYKGQPTKLRQKKSIHINNENKVDQWQQVQHSHIFVSTKQGFSEGNFSWNRELELKEHKQNIFILEFEVPVGKFTKQAWVYPKYHCLQDQITHNGHISSHIVNRSRDFPNKTIFWWSLCRSIWELCGLLCRL